MVYISTLALAASSRSSIMSAQNDLATAQKELSSGTYADLGLQLGASSGQLLQLTEQQSRLGAFTSSNAVASTRLSSTATTLTSLQTAATSFLADLTTASTSGGLTNGLQQSASANLQSLIAGLNTTVGGQAIFGGINTAATPIGPYASGSASKTAVDGAFAAAFGTSQSSSGAATVTDTQMTSFLNGSFADLFGAASFSPTWSTASNQPQSTEVAPGQTVTTSVSANDQALRGLAQAYTMVTEFAGSPISSSTQKAVVSSAMAVLTKALDGLTGLQANVGTAQSTITDAGDTITAQTTLLSAQTSGMQSVDIFALNTRLTSLQTQIQASYEVTSQLQKLSLVNYYSA